VLTIPLIVTICVAYMTADPDRVKAIFSDPDKFVTADEFLFMLTAIIVLIFGPGKFSLDWLIGKKFFKSSGKTEKT
jgi:putative oxidoreductase